MLSENCNVIRIRFGKTNCRNTTKQRTANTGLASGGLTFKRESSCGLSRPNAKPQNVSSHCNGRHRRHQQ